jgi:hypothetical protein
VAVVPAAGAERHRPLAAAVPVVKPQAVAEPQEPVVQVQQARPLVLPAAVAADEAARPCRACH